jgi:hypothetical protein
MKLPFFKLILMSVLMIALVSCDKKTPDDEDKDKPLVFTSVQAGRSMILAGDTTRISATASGYKLTYNWSVEKGDLLGSGPEITYVATPCTVGENAVNCTVKDGNGEEMTKQVVITVF